MNCRVSDTPEPLIAPGTLFQGRYEILEPIGEGGFSRVYRARQQATGREVAIKLLRSRLASNPKPLARFQRELQLCAQLYHPHIVRLLDSGQAEQAQLFLVFEFIPGRTLAQILAEEGALKPREALHLMMQVLDALGCAHAHGIIHRDLKPQNIMVTSTGVRRNALVLDFGMGTLVTEGGQAEELQARLTSSQDMIGTPAYAAPEQLRGEPASPRADLYAWGLIFLECLTGQQVIHGADLQQVLLEQFGTHPIAIPEPLEGQRLGHLLRRATAREVSERNLTARGLLRELEECSLDWGLLSSLSAPPRSTPLPPPSTPSPSGLLEGERRQITALCYALRLSGAASPAVREELLWEQHEQCTRVARGFGAQVASLLGEQALLCFGTPLAREDAAQRAAQAALALAAEVGRRSAELESSRGLRLEIRLGLHTGLITRRAPARLLRAELLAGQGLTPERAMHLAAQAPPGQVLVSEDTHRLLQGHFRLEPLGAEHRLLSPLPSSVLGAWQPPQPLPPLVGRQRELDLVLQRWAQACQGHGQSILLMGEPGAGKTRLIQEVAQRVYGTTHLLLAARCTPEPRHSPLRPFAELLWRLLGHAPEEAIEPAPEVLESLLSHLGLKPAQALPPLAHLLSLHSASETEAARLLHEHKEPIFNALLDLLFALCEPHPVLLVVGDLHHADPTTLELLSLLVDDVPTARLCMLFTARPELSPPWLSSQVLRIQLSPLERPQVEELARVLSPHRPLSPELLEQVVRRADGVPLFVQELTRQLLEHAGTEPPGVPGTLRDLLMSRLDRLGRARDTARLASVLGRSFSGEQLRVLSPLEEGELQQDLTTLVEADILLRQRTPSGPHYTFKHALLCDVACESLLDPARLQASARQASEAPQPAPGEPIAQAARWIAAHTPRNTPSGGGPYVV